MSERIAMPLPAQGSPVSDVGQFVFFELINDFLRNEIDIFQWNLLQSTSLWVGSVSLVLLTIWVMWQGYRTATGRSREPLMALVGDSLRAVLIIGLATSMAAGGSQVYWTLTDGLAGEVTRVVTGGSASPFESIDKNLKVMQGSLVAIDMLNTGGDPELEKAKERAAVYTGIGIAGPSVIAGSMLLLNKIAIALFVGLGPLFILALLFKKTASAFAKWLQYGIGTMFSLAVLSVMIGLATKMVGAISLAFLTRTMAAQALPGVISNGEGITSMAMQQGGLGLVLSVLIVMAPPMAASFFQGTLGHFAAYSSFGNVGREGGGGPQHPSQPGYQGEVPRTVEPSGQQAGQQDARPTPNYGLSARTDRGQAHNDEIKRYGSPSPRGWNE